MLFLGGLGFLVTLRSINVFVFDWLVRKLTNENVSYFLTDQSKTKTFIDLKLTRKPKPSENSTRPYLNEIPVHFTHEIKTKGYDVIGVNLFHFKLMRFHFKKRGLTGASPATNRLI